MNTEIVPFGKYKSQSVEVMLADQNYLEWVTGQPGLMTMLQSKHPALFNVITVGAPQTDDTPEHNKMQAMFLDKAFQHAFIEVVLGKSVKQISEEVSNQASQLKDLNANNELRGNRNRIASTEQDILKAQKQVEERDERSNRGYYEQELGKHKGVLQALRASEQVIQQFVNHTIVPIDPEVFLKFECGFDIEVSVRWRNKLLRVWDGDAEVDNHVFYIGKTKRGRYSSEDDVFKRIELKPQMGDDFPSVLRQMKRNGADTLVVGSFNALGCTLDEVRAIFGGIKIITLDEIRALMRSNQ